MVIQILVGEGQFFSPFIIPLLTTVSVHLQARSVPGDTDEGLVIKIRVIPRSWVQMPDTLKWTIV